MSNNFKEWKAALLAEKKKYDEEKEFKATVKKVYSKPRDYYNKLSASVKKAGHQSPGGLDCFKEENMYYSEKQTKDYLAGTSYMETYNAMKDQDNWD